jgi:hypothetical protein
MLEKCANPTCSERFDYRQGRLYCRPMQQLDGSPPANCHGVEHHWLCASCLKIYTFETQAGLGVVIAPRSTASSTGQLWPEKMASGAA